MAALELDIKQDVKDVDRMFRALGNDLINKAAAQAINKTSKTVRTHAVKAIAKTTSLKQKILRRFVSVTFKANRRKLVGIVSAKPSAINLIEFVAPSKRNIKSFRRRKGVTAKVWGGVKLHKGVFIAPGKSSGKLLAFKRAGTAKPQKIKVVYGPSIPRSFIAKRVLSVVNSRANEAWLKNFNSSLKFELSKLKR